MVVEGAGAGEGAGASGAGEAALDGAGEEGAGDLAVMLEGWSAEIPAAAEAAAGLPPEATGALTVVAAAGGRAGLAAGLSV